MALEDYSTNPDNNGTVGTVPYFPPGMLANALASANRRVMADIATWIAKTVKRLLTNDSTIQDTLTTPANRLIGYRNVPFVAPRNASALALGDMGMGHAFTGGITVPANGTVAFPVEAVVVLVNRTGSAQSITPASGVTLRLAGSTTTGTRSLAGYSSCTLWKVDTDEWWAGGTGLS